MEELNQTSSPLFKKIDQEVFDRIDKFKTTPGYNNLQDFYNGLEEEQQKLFKAGSIVLIFLLPLMLLGFLFWQNGNLKDDMEMRLSLINRANEIIGQKQNLRTITPSLLSQNPIDGNSMMTTRLSNLLSNVGIDLSKIQVSQYNGEMISSSIMRSEADFAFNNLSTDELMNIFSAMIQREKFRIESVDIVRNSESNLLKGTFHGIHFSNAQTLSEEE